jgi:stage V sporulation protein AE
MILTKALLAFILGGAICAIAQVLIDKTKLTPAKILVGFVLFGILLGGIGLYEPIFKIFGCGISVPLIGFGSAVANGVREEVIKNGFIGVLSGSFSAMGAGCVLSLVLGFFISIFFRGKSKRM